MIVLCLFAAGSALGKAPRTGRAHEAMKSRRILRGIYRPAQSDFIRNDQSLNITRDMEHCNAFSLPGMRFVTPAPFDLNLLDSPFYFRYYQFSTSPSGADRSAITPGTMAANPDSPWRHRMIVEAR
jgi:hypothetical protein